MFTTSAEIDRKTSPGPLFNNQLSNFKQFKSGSKIQIHKGTKKGDKYLKNGLGHFNLQSFRKYLRQTLVFM